MPELPEVEVICRGVRPHIVDRKVLAVHFSGKKLRLPLPLKKMKDLLLGNRVVAVERRAKYLLFRAENGAVLIIHLGMSGKLGIFPISAEKQKHDHLRLLLDNDMEIRFNDPRRFGSVQFLSPEESVAEHFSACGVEPFAEAYSVSYLQEKAAKRKQPVKNFLLDGRVVAGIGNIYASEILFMAGILPTRGVHTLSKPQWARIIAATRQVLQEAIRQGGSSISDFVNFSGEKGYFQNSLSVYGRDGKVCGKCGKIIKRKVMAGRATFYCNKCQT